MHSALTIPEIVATIIGTYPNSRPFLYSCLFVNRLFSVEASRLLWYRCGSEWEPDYFVSPRIRHLVKIAEDLKRAQFYAKFIHILTLGYDRTTREYPGHFMHVPCNEVENQSGLEKLKFSALHTLHIDNYEEDTKYMKTLNSLLLYADKGLKELAFFKPMRLSDMFLERLVAKSPRLSIVSFVGDEHQSGLMKLSDSGMISFFQKSSCLSTVRMREGFNDVWSADLLDAVMSLQDLTVVTLPDIPNGWVHSGNMNGFTSLQELDTGMANTSLELLLSSLRHLVKLRLDQSNYFLNQQRCSRSLLGLVSNLGKLKSLTVRFPYGSTIKSHDLMLLAKGCSNLRSLHVPCNGYSENPSGEGIEDAIMKSLHSVYQSSTKSVSSQNPQASHINLSFRFAKIAKT